MVVGETDPPEIVKEQIPYDVSFSPSNLIFLLMPTAHVLYHHPYVLL
jgi:hypothetical protein